eukprot:Pompholyxophrys_sp_v1_NODE_168_length_1391_cov_1.406577.p2 type:complete len:108 gc:universal NODE_168_length_1391_cov_1.406577:1128-805(-)
MQETHLEAPLKLVKSAFTRWLSHDRVTEVLYTRFLCVLLSLKNESENGDATAAGLLFNLCKREFVFVLSMLRDVLIVLARLSRLLQSQSADLSVFENLLPAIKELQP